MDEFAVSQLVGVVFQSFNLFRNMTVLENVCEGLTTARGMEKAKAIDIATKMLEKVVTLPQNFSDHEYSDTIVAGRV